MKFIKNLILFTVFLLPFSSNLKAENNSRVDPRKPIEEGFVTYGTEDYFPIMKVLLDSIKAFSTRPIVAFGINADIPFSSKEYPFLVKKRIDIASSRKEDIFYLKAKVILESNIRQGIYVDSDIILNHGFDVLFEHCQKITNCPLAPLFPSTVNNQQAVMHAMGIEKKSMDYVHGPLIIFSEKSHEFMEEWNQNNIQYGEVALSACHDETILNVLLWKHEATNYLDLCDPYYALCYDYLGGGTVMHTQHGYENWINKIDFHTFHGSKRGDESKLILDLLIEKVSYPNGKNNNFHLFAECRDLGDARALLKTITNSK